ncbi:MAG: hypothetical protein ACK4EX_01930 [Thermaurantimonas sp.]|uniref:hypothetical protein n=1 Tax=Thermaurantimonas sp. TaxID=2681568 RepID=UPI00391D9A01
MFCFYFLSLGRAPANGAIGALAGSGYFGVRFAPVLRLATLCLRTALPRARRIPHAHLCHPILFIANATSNFNPSTQIFSLSADSPFEQYKNFKGVKSL